MGQKLQNKGFCFERKGPTGLEYDVRQGTRCEHTQLEQKYAVGLFSCNHKAAIEMRSRRLLWLDDDKSAANCQHA